MASKPTALICLRNADIVLCECHWSIGPAGPLLRQWSIFLHFMLPTEKRPPSCVTSAEACAPPVGRDRRQGDGDVPGGHREIPVAIGHHCAQPTGAQRH